MSFFKICVSMVQSLNGNVKWSHTRFFFCEPVHKKWVDTLWTRHLISKPDNIKLLDLKRLQKWQNNYKIVFLLYLNVTLHISGLDSTGQLKQSEFSGQKPNTKQKQNILGENGREIHQHQASLDVGCKFVLGELILWLVAGRDEMSTTAA